MEKFNRNRSNRKIKTETVQMENFKESVQTEKLKEKPFKWKNLNRSRSNGKIKTETVQTEKLIQKLVHTERIKTETVRTEK